MPRPSTAAPIVRCTHGVASALRCVRCVSPGLRDMMLRDHQAAVADRATAPLSDDERERLIVLGWMFV